MFNVKNYFNWQVACALLGAASLFSSCSDNLIYDDLAPCETRHAIRFQWDTNMLRTDAFRGNVHSVAVYGFDKEDKLAFELAEKGDALAMQGYTLSLAGIEPGEYTVVAWCGLDNDTRSESFLVSDTEIGITTRQELLCRMEREIHPDGTHHSSERLYDLYHGTAYGVQIYEKEDMEHQGDHVYNVNLTKDTNNVRVMLQQFGKDVDVNDYSFHIEEANGTLGSENELKDDAVINYEPFNEENGEVDAETRAAGAVPGLGVAIADMKMSRLMARRTSLLIIRNEKNDEVLQIPLQKYALLARNFDAKDFTDQEYLDCEDNYELLLFLDSNGTWSTSRIIVNSWTIYTNPANLDD